MNTNGQSALRSNVLPTGPCGPPWSDSWRSVVQTPRSTFVTAGLGRCDSILKAHRTCDGNLPPGVLRCLLLPGFHATTHGLSLRRRPSAPMPMATALANLRRCGPGRWRASPVLKLRRVDPYWLYTLCTSPPALRLVHRADAVPASPALRWAAAETATHRKSILPAPT